MALNFGLLDPDMPAKIAGSVYAGQQERMQNELAQQQAAMRQQEFGMRQQEFAAQQEDRRLAKARAAENQKLLTNLSTLMEANGHKLDRPTLGQMYSVGIQTGQHDLTKLATQGLQALDEQEGHEADMVRFGLAPPKATAAPANALAPSTAPFEGEVANALGVTSTPVASRPLPVGNALVAPGVAPAPATGQINQAMVQQMILSKNALTRAQGAALERTLPKENRYNVPGVGLVDLEGKVIVPATKNIANINPNDFTPASIQKFSQSGNYSDLIAKKSAGTGEGAATKAPMGYRFTKSGDLEPIPGGPAAGKPLTELQQLKFKKDFATDTSHVKASVTTADELEKLTDELVGNPQKQIAPHPGLRGITGWSALLPSAPSGDASKAQQKLDTFQGKIKALGRQLASQEGKLGNMAVQEWKMVSDAVQAIDPKAGNLDQQMRDVVRQARALSNNLQEKFDLTYEDQAKPAASAASPAPARAGGPAVVPAKTKSGATASNW